MTIKNLLETIKEDSLAARKAKDKVASSLLLTLYSEALLVGKNKGDRLPTDEEVIKVVKRFITSVEENLKYRPDNEDYLIEKSLLQRYVPKQLSEDQLKYIIRLVGEPVSPKSTKKVLEYINEHHPGQADGAMVIDIIKRWG